MAAKKLVRAAPRATVVVDDRAAEPAKNKDGTMALPAVRRGRPDRPEQLGKRGR